MSAAFTPGLWKVDGEEIVCASPVGKADAPKDSHPDKPGVGG